jgi:hypothetical protein
MRLNAPGQTDVQDYQMEDGPPDEDNDDDNV